MPLSSSELARREEGQVLVRGEPLRARWTFGDLISGDGHALRCVFACSVRALPEAAERQMLAEVFLTQVPVLTAHRMMDYFETSLRSAAAAVCQGKSAEYWIGAGRAELSEALRAAGKRLAFSAGLELLPPFELEVESATLERQRLEQMQRELAEERAAGQMEHFQRATELLRQFESIRQAQSKLTPGEVLKQISPADQGMMLQTLLLASAKEKVTESIWAVAGPSLLRIDPRQRPLKAQVIEMPAGLGPLRSVQPCEGGLLLGARAGVMEADPARPQEARKYEDPAVTSQLGFSRAVMWHDEIWACHSEAGVVAWKRGQGDGPICALRPVDLGSASAKNLQVLDERRLVFSAGERLVALVRKNVEEGAAPVLVAPVEPAAGAEVVAVLPEPGRVTVVLSDGRVQARSGESLSVIREQRPCGAISAACLLPWLGSTRILLATEDGPIMCVGWEDELVTQYQSVYRGLRAVEAAADVIAGLSADRQRIVFWNSWDGRQPAGDVYVPAAARHRAADVAV